MNRYSIFILKLLKRIYSKIFPTKKLDKLVCEENPDKASEIIYDKLVSNEPCMIGRFGSTELNMIINYLGIIDSKNSVWRYLNGESQPWWWEKNRMLQMQNWSGFFPPTEKKIETFCKLMLEDIKELNVLGSWLPDEKYFVDENSKIKLINLEILNPFFTNKPWTKALEGKRILVVHPLAELIRHQYEKKRINLFKNQDILPEFYLETIEAVQSLGGNNEFKDWFAALDYMKKKIDCIDYDVCLIGCGAYGFPLAAHVKRQGKKAVHLGGSLQLLFGIKGKRWEDPNYNKNYNYSELMNEYWIRPDEKFKPQNAAQVEGGCYW